LTLSLAFVAGCGTGAYGKSLLKITLTKSSPNFFCILSDSSIAVEFAGVSCIQNRFFPPFIWLVSINIINLKRNGNIINKTLACA